MKSIRITAREFQDEVERYLELAGSQNVTITREGGDVVLVSADEYAQLALRADRVAMPTDALTGAELKELERSKIPEETRALDHLVPKDWGKT